MTHQNSTLHNLKFTKGSRHHKRKVVGRGYGSGMGKRATRGQKGQHARKSGNVRLGFEGGQTPLYRKVPKVGFNNKKFAKKIVTITTDQIADFDKVDRTSLIQAKLITKHYKGLIKVIAGKKKLNKPIELHVDKISNGAIKMINDQKGKVIVNKQQ